MDSFLTHAKHKLEDLKNETKSIRSNISQNISSAFEGEIHSHTHFGKFCHSLHNTVHNRYHSFAPERTQDNAKYYIDGCAYFYAVSLAIEKAEHEIWIMDWWLSPELYLRRPPMQNEQYRLDRMLKAAAERGVKVNVMVYKEVSGVLTTCSEHTKHALEALHQNIAVFRHPDHNPSARVISSEIISGFKNMSFSHASIASLPHDGLEKLYGLSDDVILYWAHHEKLCLIDGHTVFMGGLDLCYGRWDTHQHQTADAHPSDIGATIWPGQDFNNGRIMDFQDVSKPFANKLDRTKDVRMGWSDLSVCLQGPVVEDFRAHFVSRWNWIYGNKYASVSDVRYKPLTLDSLHGGPSKHYHTDGSNVINEIGSQQLIGAHHNAAVPEDIPQPPGAFSMANEGEHHPFFHPKAGGLLDTFEGHLHRAVRNTAGPTIPGEEAGVMAIQMVRSASRWSHGIPTEHSIANAYIEVIQNAKHFIYIENQFFITATDSKQYPVKNKIGAAIVDRIIRAHEAGIKFKVIVCIPAVPGFAGDLHDEGSAGTLAIMNFQYNSICRGGHSILEKLIKAGIELPEQYISFFNLRNYDRINTSKVMKQAEAASGVDYETARKEHDDTVGAGYAGRGEESAATSGNTAQFDAYQKEASNSTIADTVSPCYMLDGPPLTSMNWDSDSSSEMDAFVSEELYIHTKCLIADDRVVIVGSANLNDRSQLGYHDSEMAVVIEDSNMVDSELDGHAYQASKFATLLRRMLFRKHLGLLAPQDFTKPDVDFMPAGEGENSYDFGSAPDLAVRDVLSDNFQNLWKSTAAKNTEIFDKAFAPVPNNRITTWELYESEYASLFVSPSPKGTKEEDKKPSKYAYGHVVKDNFPGGVGELKEWLGGVRGTLVTMPLDFLSNVKDLVKEGLGYNAMTEEIYT